MADEKYTAEVGVDVSDMERSLAQGAKALSTFGSQIDLAATRMERFQRASAAFKMPTFNTAMQMPDVSQFGASTKAAAFNAGIGRASIEEIKAQEAAYASYSKNIAFTADRTRDLQKAQRDAFASYAPNIRATQELAKASQLSAAAQKEAYASYAPNIRASQQSAIAERERTKVFNQSAEAQTRYAAQAQRNGVAYGQEVSGSLNETRYALYDVAATWASVSAATLGAVVAIEQVGVAYESAFTGVERTSGAVGDRLGELRDNLVNMSTAMPSSFAEIADVATLGGQLGIAEDGIEDFTETVIQLGATTNLTLEQAGTAFGRFKALLGTPESEFSNLGSAILKVGVNSAATETQIVQVATQISSLSTLAGLTADQTVGLAGALASVGAAPELSRGTITRVFSLMNQAVADGGEELTKFAALAGMSASEFQAAWGTDQAAGAFQSFLQGIDSEGQNAISVLNDLGITSVRDVPLLLRLANAGDVVTGSFADAASGYAENSELANQYGMVADDTASLLLMLGNTIKAIADEAANLGILNTGIELLQRLADAALAFVRNPIGKVISSVGLSIGVVIGVMAAYRAGMALAQASAAGLIVAQNALSSAATRNALSIGVMAKNMLSLAVGTDRATAASARFNAVMGATGFDRIRVGAAGAGSAIQSMGAGLGSLVRFVGPMAALTAAVAAGSMIWNEYSESQKTALDRSREFYGDLSGLMEAVRQDSAASYTGEVYRELTQEVFAGASAVSERANTLAMAAGIEADAANAVDSATEAVERQTAVIGENALAWIQNSVANNPEMLEIWKQYGTAIEGTGFELSKFLELSAQSQTLGADYLNKFKQESIDATAALRDANGEMYTWDETTRNTFATLSAQNGGFRELSENLLGTGGLFTELAAQIQLSGAATGETNALLAETEGELEGTNSELEESIKLLKEMTDAALGPGQSMYDLAGAVSSLGQSLYDNGTSFDMFTEGGRSNMESLQSVISAAVASSEGDSAVLAANLKAIMGNLLAYGVDVANEVPSLLALYNQLVGGAGQVVTARNRLFSAADNAGAGTVLKAPLKSITLGVTGLGKASIDTGKAMREGFSSGAEKAAKSASKAGKGAKDAAKEMYSLSDYVRDLGSVFSNAFDIRFGLGESIDNVSAQFRSMQEDSRDAADAVVSAMRGLEDARQDVADLNVELAELAANLATLQADKAVLQYQLGVATEYGDTLRAQEIAAELQEVEAELAKVQNDRSKTSNDLSRAQQGVTDASVELNDAQQAAIRTLSSGTASSEEQRAAVLKLVQGYQGQITALANSGLSTDQLRNKTAELKKQFEDQLRQLGYNNTEIQRYSKAFDDMAAAINRIPRNITVSASTDPAQRAIDEFMARNTGGRGASAGVDVPIRSGGYDDSQVRRASRALALQAQISAMMSQLTAWQLIPGMAAPAAALSAQIQALKNILNSGNYASGGFTGRGGKYDPAGVVHRGEFVVPKHMVNQNTGLPYADALGKIATGYAGGGYVNAAPSINVPNTMFVELSPTDRALLAAAGNVTITVDGRVLASTVNNTNTRTANRG